MPATPATPAPHEAGHDGAEHTETKKEEEPDATWEVQDPSYMPWESLPDGPGESGGPDAPDASGGGPDAPDASDDAADDAVDATDAAAGGGIIPAGGLAARHGPTPPWRGGTWNAWGKSRGMGRGNGRGKGKGKGKPYRGNRGGRGRNEPKSKGESGKGKKRWQGDDDEDDDDHHAGGAASHLAHLLI